MLNIIRRQAAKYLLSQQNKPKIVSDLKFAFMDTEGQRYYEWTDLSEIPVCRHSELMQMISFSDAKISPESLESLCVELDKQNHLLSDSKVRQKAQARMFALTNEIRDRSSFSVPKSIMTRIAAILICREDEKPDSFNNEINEQKVAQFTKDLNDGNAFFLKSSLMKELYPSLLGTTERLTKHLANWEQEAHREISRLKIILQSDESNAEEKTTPQ